MPRSGLLRLAIVFVCGASIVASTRRSAAAEIAILNEVNWDQFAPGGKEVDAIYGDIVLRNDKLVAVIAQPVDGRNANMTIKNVGGCLIDFTTREAQNDQLGAFFPLGKAATWRTENATTAATGKSVSIAFTAKLNDALTAETKFVLADGADYLAIGTTIKNSSGEEVVYEVKDETVVQGSVVKGATGKLVWTYDRWWNAAYGVLSPADAPSTKHSVPAKGETTVARKVFVAHDLAGLQAAAATEQPPTVMFPIVQGGRTPVRDAYVELKKQDKLITAGKTNANGVIALPIESLSGADLTVSHPSRGEKVVHVEQVAAKPGDGRSVVMFEPKLVDFAAPGTVAATVTDDRGGPIPCKVQFRGVDSEKEGGTKDPVFFDKTGEHAVGNLYYSHDGRFTLDLPPGKYDCTVSHGNEFDAVYKQIEVNGGSQTPLAAKLIRTVQTPGWISADFHNHASPSGDNSSSQYGRVLNLLAEHVEFAPCTEHNRISSYLPHLQRLKAEKLLATCSGIELTGSPFATNHHNAFPLKLHEHKQDGGGPTVDAETEVSVERLVLWDDRSPKLIQQNHPDIGYLYFDKNADGVPDAGFERALGHLDCIEVHPPHFIFAGPDAASPHSASRNNPMFNWLQLLNQGHRIPGVVNTDAHYNIHGSGWLRNYIVCRADDPAQIDVHDMVHAAEHGHMIMTNGPYLEVTLKAAEPGERRAASVDAPGAKSVGIPGDDVIAPSGKAALHVRVQCANWYDVDRVQVFVNGKPEPKLNFTRSSTPDAFSDLTLRFEREIPLALAADAHVIVAAIGENSGLGHVMGPEHAADKPTAVSNPIFVDVDGNGFTANKDTLGAPLPVKAADKKK
jgi:hypothetical protein